MTEDQVKKIFIQLEDHEKRIRVLENDRTKVKSFQEKKPVGSIENKLREKLKICMLQFKGSSKTPFSKKQG